MSRKSFKQVYISLACGIACFGWAIAANAGYLTADGDFGAQTVGGVLGSPWNAFGGGTVHSILSTSQSPFTNAFANNGKAPEVAASAGNPYFVQSFTDIPADATGTLYLNVDFRNNSASDDAWVLGVSNSGFTDHTIIMGVTTTGLWSMSTDNGQTGWGNSILTPAVGTWYNVQLTLDMDHNTYSGTVTPWGGASVAISSRGFYANGVINNLFSDGASDGNTNVAADHDIDNFVLSNTPIPSVPEPSTLVLVVMGLIGLSAYAWRKRT
jgi:hypothetical protein